MNEGIYDFGVLEQTCNNALTHYGLQHVEFLETRDSWHFILWFVDLPAAPFLKRRCVDFSCSNYEGVYCTLLSSFVIQGYQFDVHEYCNKYMSTYMFIVDVALYYRLYRSKVWFCMFGALNHVIVLIRQPREMQDIFLAKVLKMMLQKDCSGFLQSYHSCLQGHGAGQWQMRVPSATTETRQNQGRFLQLCWNTHGPWLCFYMGGGVLTFIHRGPNKPWRCQLYWGAASTASSGRRNIRMYKQVGRLLRYSVKHSGRWLSWWFVMHV